MVDIKVEITECRLKLAKAKHLVCNYKHSKIATQVNLFISTKHLNYGRRLFGFQSSQSIFFILRVGGKSMWGGACQNRLWRGIQFLTIELYTSFISQLSEIVNFHNIDCSFMSFLQYKISELIRPLFFPVDIYRRCCKLNFGPLHGSGEL